MLILYQKYVYSLNNTLLSSPYFVKKIPFSQKHCALMSFFFQNFHEKPLLSSPYLVKRTSILSKLHFILGQKSCRNAFFSIFVWKITALMPIFCQKNVHSLKNTLFSFHEKPPAVKPNGQKSHKSVKTTLYYGPKKSKGYPFFPIFHEKMTARMTIFCQKKYSFSKKHTAIIPIFVQKNVNSL